MSTGAQQHQPSEDPLPDGMKAWEVPWSIGKMKHGSKNWTLAADAGVSLYGDGRGFGCCVGANIYFDDMKGSLVVC